jgi:hypothetical protein
MSPLSVERLSRLGPWNCGQFAVSPPQTADSSNRRPEKAIAATERRIAAWAKRLELASSIMRIR